MGLSLCDMSDVSWQDPAFTPEGPARGGNKENSPLVVGWSEHTVTFPTSRPAPVLLATVQAIWDVSTAVPLQTFQVTSEK